jgi:septal ring factor EnvC (AmiA/AmiB activator)
MTDTLRKPLFPSLLEQRIVRLEKRMDDIAAMLNGIKSRLDEVERRLDAASAWINAIQEERDDSRGNQGRSSGSNETIRQEELPTLQQGDSLSRESSNY